MRKRDINPLSLDSEENLSWMKQGECRGSGISFFLPELYEVQMSMCGVCPVQKECLDFAIRNNEYGVWGGKTEKEREALLS